MSSVIKLSARESKDYWELPVLYEDESLLALDKPHGLLVSPEHEDPDRPSLLELLRSDIKRNASWTRQREVQYLENTHRLEFETSGVLLLAKNRAALSNLANQFGSEKRTRSYVTLVRGTPGSDAFSVTLNLSPRPNQFGIVQPDFRRGKKALTDFNVLEVFAGYALIECHPLTYRLHQIRAHLNSLRLPIVGDTLYRSGYLNLSSLKSNYRLKPGKTERPLISRTALHSNGIRISHPVTQQPVEITAPWPNDLKVAVKYLRRYAPSRP